MKHYEFTPKGTCSFLIMFDLDELERVRNVRFSGGCDGNLQAVIKLVEGMDVSDVIERLKGIRCGMKETSCPDQFARALEQALEQG